MQFVRKIAPKASSNNIGKRIARLVGLSVFTAVLVAALSLTYLQAIRELDARKGNLENTGYILAATAADAVVVADKPAILASLRSVARIPSISTVSVWDNQGNSLASMGQTTFLNKDIAVFQEHGLSLLFKGTLPIAVDIVKGGKLAGKLVLHADISDLRTNLIKSILSTLISGALAAWIGVMVSKPLLRRVVKPITELTQNISSIRKSRDYSMVLGSAANNGESDEVGVLVESFNELMSDIRFRDQSLQQLAYYDALTGLPNRIRFQHVLETLSRQTNNTTATVVLFNISGFRSMNDAFGHSMGNAILLTVAAMTQQECGPGATLARVGGDEFALLAPEATNFYAAQNTIAKIQAVFFKPIAILHLELHVVLTAGAVLFNPSTEDAGTVLRHADLALNAAKVIGPGRVAFFKPEMSEAVQRETEIGQALRRAIQNNALEIHYQAQFDYTQQRVTGFEALARWRNADGKFVSPAEFIPIAEKAGLIVQLGDLIMRKACEDASRWSKNGHAGQSVSINVSPAQVLEAGFVAKTARVLEKVKLPQHLLCLELTENLFLGNDLSKVTAVLNELRGMGILLALDDFGTGYSSFGYLSKLPFDEIKVDRAFVANAEQSKQRTEILKSIIQMVHSLDMRVVAEGAETPAELLLLKKLGADKVQGYGIAKPLPLQEALAMASTFDTRDNKAMAD